MCASVFVCVCEQYFDSENNHEIKLTCRLDVEFAATRRFIQMSGPWIISLKSVILYQERTVRTLQVKVAYGGKVDR